MIKLGLYSIAAAGIIAISGCASQSEEALEPGFRTARAQSNLELPPDLINTSSEALKRRAEKSATDKVLPQIEGLEIKRSENDERWLQVNADIDSTWDKLVDFTLKSNMPVLTQSKRDAIIESDWIGDKKGGLTERSRLLKIFGNFGSRSAINDSYTFWLERSETDQTALYISHKQLKQVAKTRAFRDEIVETAWIETSGDGFKAVEMLRNIKAFFSGEIEEDVSDEVVLITDDSPSIIFQADMIGTRNKLRSALVAANLEFVSENKKKNLIVVREHRKKGGVFSKLTPRKKQGIKFEPYGDTEKTKITVTSSRGSGVDSKESLPLLYRLAGELRKE